MFKHFGEAVGLLRRLRGMTQESLARSATVGRSQLSRYESGQQLPHLQVLERLLVALDVTLAELATTISFLDRISKDDDLVRERHGVVPTSIAAALQEIEKAHEQLRELVTEDSLMARR